METGKKSAIISRSIQEKKPKESTSADIRSLNISPGPDISASIQSPSRKTARHVLREAPELNLGPDALCGPGCI